MKKLQEYLTSQNIICVAILKMTINTTKFSFGHGLCDDNLYVAQINTA